MSSAFDELFEDPLDSPDSKLDLEGRVVGSFRIGTLIADQPACQVYIAHDVLLDRPAALKILKQNDWHGTDVSSRFRLEGRILAKLRHPNIVQLYSFHEVDTMPCLAMEFIDGGTLADIIRNRALPVSTSIQVLLRIARAVAAAHRLGIIHRDLKPQNILIDSSIIEPALDTPVGFIKVADFGIARILESLESLTLTGMQPGTALYMAPEQVEARSRDICPATDVFSLGAILYTMLTGASPFASPSVADSLQKIVRSDTPLLSDVNPDTPDWLVAIFHKCMEKHPRDRFQNAEDLADEIAANMGQNGRQRRAVSRRVASLTPLLLILAATTVLLAAAYRLLTR